MANFITAADVNVLSKLPGKDEMRAQLLSDRSSNGSNIGGHGSIVLKRCLLLGQ